MSGVKRRPREEEDAEAEFQPTPAQAAFLAATALERVTMGEETFFVRHVPDLDTALGAADWPTLTLPGEGLPKRVLCALFGNAELLMISATEDGQEVGCFTSDALPDVARLLAETAGPATIEELFSANYELQIAGGFTALNVPDLVNAEPFVGGDAEAE